MCLFSSRNELNVSVQVAMIYRCVELDSFRLIRVAGSVMPMTALLRMTSSRAKEMMVSAY